MAITYILSISDFSERADITANLNTEKLKSYIGVVQEKYALKILCREFLDELLVEVANDSLSTNNNLLVNGSAATGSVAAKPAYLKNYLIYKVYERYLLNANIHSTLADCV